MSAFERVRIQSQSSQRNEPDLLEVTIEKQILKLCQASKPLLSVLIVDDEGVYRNSLAALLNRSEELKERLQIICAKNSKEALKFCQAAPSLVILDVDLGPCSLGGYEVVEKLRKQGFEGVICIHSNRSTTEDFTAAVAAGADAVLPKPMSRAHVLKLVLNAAERAHVSAAVVKSSVVLPEFAVVDDSKLVLRSWQRKSKGQATVHTFESPAAFRAAQNGDSGFLSRISVVVTDFYFAQGVTETGFSFGQELKKIFAKPVLLSSDGEFKLSDLAGCVDRVIAKVPVSWLELSTQVQGFELES